MSSVQLHGRILVLGYGNPGRQDDGLGPAAVEAIQDLQWRRARFETNYSLVIEDAEEVAAHDCVLFVDAAEAGPEPFEVRELVPESAVAFTSHILKPEGILAICRKYYGRVPRAFLLAIRGYEFELKEELTLRARTNLRQAIESVATWPVLERRP